MKTEKSDFSRRSFPRLLVLVPHRDARLPMREWSGALFAAGLPGAWSFPWVAPLAALDRGLSDAELRALARGLRERSMPGKVVAGPVGLAPLPFTRRGERAHAFGPSLDIALPETLFPAANPGDEGPSLAGPISPGVLGSALLYGPPPDGLQDPPPIAFRAAALAIMRFSPLATGGGRGDYSFEWEIGKPYWLPK